MKLHVFHPAFNRNDHRGDLIEIINGSRWQNISYGHIKKNAMMGNHYHKKTIVFFFLLKGNAIVDVVNAKTQETGYARIKQNEGIIFGPYISHAIRFQRDSMFLMGKSKKYDISDTFQLIVPEVHKLTEQS